MPMTLLLNGVDYSPNMLWETISVSESPQSNGQTMSVTIMTQDSSPATPVGGETVQFFNADGGLEFAGRVSLVDQAIRQNIRWATYQLTCVDWTSDFDRHLIQEVFTAQLAGDVVRRVIGLVGSGFTSVDVVDGAIIDGFTSDLEYPSQIISRAAESIEHQWFIDHDRSVKFYYIQDLAAPIDTIAYDTDITTFFDLEFSEDVSQIKNRIWLIGAKVSSSGASGGALSDNINFTADGDTKFVPLNYEPVSKESMAVTKNGTPQTVLLDSIDGFAGDGQGVDGQVYLCLDNWGLRFPDDHAPADGDVVNLDYAYNYEPVVQVEDTDSIALMKSRENSAIAPSDGVHEFRYNMPEIKVDSEDAIIEYGTLLLARYAFPIDNVKLKSWIQGWKPGQSLRIYSAAHGFDATFYLQTVAKRPVINTTAVSFFEYDLSFGSTPFTS